MRCISQVYEQVVLSFVDYEAVVKLSDGFNGADLRNVCTEAGNRTFCLSVTVPADHNLVTLISYVS